MFRLSQDFFNLPLDPFMLLLALKLIQVIVVILHPEDFLLDNFDLILGLKTVLVLVKGWNEVLVYDWVQLYWVDMGQFVVVNWWFSGHQFVQLVHGLLHVRLCWFFDIPRIKVIFSWKLIFQSLIWALHELILRFHVNCVEVVLWKVHFEVFVFFMLVINYPVCC